MNDDFDRLRLIEAIAVIILLITAFSLVGSIDYADAAMGLAR